MDFTEQDQQGLELPQFQESEPDFEPNEASLEFDENLEEQQEPEPLRFDDNLALEMDESRLSGLAADLLEAINADKESRSTWENAISESIKYLGINLEQNLTSPYKGARGVFSTTMQAAVNRIWSGLRAEVLPLKGMAEVDILGQINEQKSYNANILKNLFNYYLLYRDEDYYSDSDRMLLYLTTMGCAFKKVYYDPVKQMPIARFIEPQNLVVNNDAVSLREASRIAQIIFITKKELMLRMEMGMYKKFKISELFNETKDNVLDIQSRIEESIRQVSGFNDNTFMGASGDKNKNMLMLFEIHVDLQDDDLEQNVSGSTDDESIPKPYIVTICGKQILSIYRNWRENDPMFSRKHYFVHYNYMPNFGIYGLGVFHLAASNAIASTDILRQLIASGVFANSPPLIMTKQVQRDEKMTLTAEIGVANEIENGGLDINQSIMQLNIREPSQVLLALLQLIATDTNNVLGTADIAIAENNVNAPVGTTLALLETSTRMMTSAMRNIHKALTEELNLIYELFAENMGDEPYPFSLGGQNFIAMREIFDPDFRLKPISDPTIASNSQRIIRNEVLMRIAQQNPQLHDMREVLRRFYQSINVDDIDKIMPLPQQAQPLDPMTENINATNGKPVVAGMEQNHDAHIAAHQSQLMFLQAQMPQSPGLQILNAHITEHQNMKYMLEVQAATGIDLQQMDLQQPQNQEMLAQAMQQYSIQRTQELQQQMQANKPIDPTQVMMMDVQNKVKVAEDKKQYEENKLTLDAFKTILDYNSKQDKIKADQDAKATDILTKDESSGKMPIR